MIVETRALVDSEIVNVADLPSRHDAMWARATRHEFLTAVRDGTIPQPAFNTWLAQDYLFVADLVRFQARLLARAPRLAQAVLAGGLVALVDELTWFEEKAGERRIDLSAAPLPATSAYRRLLDRLDGEPFADAFTMLWALERTYFDAWSYALPGAPLYREFVGHWSTPEFAAYVSQLEAVANEVLPEGTDVDAWFGEVVRAEIGFWEMAWDRAT